MCCVYPTVDWDSLPPPSFGLCNGAPLVVQSPLMPNQPANASLLMNPSGGVLRMNPLTQLQVAIKNNVGVHYFSTCVNMNVLLSEDGRMGEL